MNPVARVILVAILVLHAEGAQAETGGRQKAVVRRIYDPAAPKPAAGALMHAGKDHLTEGIYHEFRNATVELMRRYPPNEHFFIGLGRSPAPMVAFLQNLERKGQRAAVNFPASGLRSGRVAGKEAAYEEHFAHFIPPEVLKGKRTIVIFDRSVSGSGGSIHKVKTALEDYLAKIGSKAKVVGVSYSNGAPNSSYGLDYLSTSEFPELLSTNTSAYEDHIAEYPHHAISASTKPADAGRRPQYDQYREHMRSRQVADSELDHKLKEWKIGGKD
jgi:hypothetical protein